MMNLSFEANEMHAGAAEYDERAEVMAELNGRESADRADGAEAMADAAWEGAMGSFWEYMGEYEFGAMMSRANE